MLRRAEYYFRETVTGLRRNGLVAFAAVSTVFISLFLFGGALLIGRQIDLMVSETGKQVEVAVFLTDNISDADRARLQSLLQQMPEVATVRYESKHQAYERFLQLFKNQPALVNNVDPNALPASFRVKLVDPQNFGVVAARLQGQPGVDNIVDNRETLKRLFAVSKVLRWSALGGAVVMLIAAIGLIANTVRMAVFARRKEIGIMRLVGATNMFIRIPFMIEAVIQSLLGASVAVLGLYIARRWFVGSLANTIAFIPLIQGHDMLVIVPLLLTIGVVAAIVASLFAMRRFLEV